MKKKAELYFIIYLATIVSFFTIEGELKEYKQRQEDILHEVSKQVADDLVDIIDNNNTISGHVRFDFNVNGDDFIRDSLNGYAIFEDESIDTTYKYSLKRELGTGKYSIDVSTRDFINSNAPHKLSLDLFTIPDISPATIRDWSALYGSDKIAYKIADLLESRGGFWVRKNIEYSFVPFQPAEFTLKSTGRTSAIKGTKWSHTVYPGGADAGDYNIEIIGGQRFVEGAPDITQDNDIILKGMAEENVKIDIKGTRLSDGQVATHEFSISVVEPRLRQDPIEDVCINELFEFNGSLFDINPSEISLGIQSDDYPDLLEEQIENSHAIDYPGFPTAGVITFNVYKRGVDSPVLTHTVTVMEPQAPEVSKFLTAGCNKLKFTVTAFCTDNTIDEFYEYAGISNYEKVNESIYESKTVVEYKIQLSPPANKNSTVTLVQFEVVDKQGKATLVEEKTEYDYNCQ